MHFLISSTRAGSTLFSRLLNSHTDLSCPFEFMIPELLPFFHWKNRQARAKLKQIMEYYKIDLQKNKSVIDKYNKIEKIICEHEKSKIFIAKEPYYARILDNVIRKFPASKYIILIRHPLKVAQSISNAWGNDDGISRWVQHYEKIIRLHETIDHIQIKYEDLVTNPVKTLNDVCRYLDVEFENQMIYYNRSQHTDDKLELWGVTSSREQVAKTIKSVSTGKIDSTMAQIDLSIIDYKHIVMLRNNIYGSRDIAEYFGYDISNI